MYEYYLGIDPSKVNGESYGGIAILDIEGNPCEIIKLNQRPQIIYHALSTLLKGKSCAALLEKTWAMRGQGAMSSFSFGHGNGVVEAFMVALNIPCFKVGPKEWMAYYDLKKEKGEKLKAWKGRLCERANIIFPDLNDDPYLCDSLLIANYLHSEIHNIYTYAERA